MQEKIGMGLIGLGFGMIVGGLIVYAEVKAQDKKECVINHERHLKERSCPDCVARTKHAFDNIVADL